jgi:flagellar protein FlgJ
MATFPQSDIVLEVAQAADPARAAQVARRLSALAGHVDASNAGFPAALDQLRPAKVAPAPEESNGASQLAATRVAGNDRASRVQVQFESMLLNSFVSEMLPKEAPDAYGQGLAGEMWRSLLAEKISGEIAGSGALGIGRRLFLTHPLSASASQMGAAKPGETAHVPPVAMSANPISMASGARFDEGAFLFPAPKPR